MKSKLFLIILVLPALILGACNGASSNAQEKIGTTPSGPMGENNGTAPSGTLGVFPSGGGDPSEALQLALGMFKLDETDTPIDAAQAAKLLPLWKAARSLGQSDTAAVQEISALIKQIQNTLTAGQQQAIQDMDLSFDDLPAIAEKLGLAPNALGGMGGMDPSARATAQASGEGFQMPPGGEIPGGGAPGAGGPPAGGEMGGMGGPEMQMGQDNSEARQTAMAQRGSRGATMGLSPALFDAIIKFLEDRVQQ